MTTTLFVLWVLTADTKNFYWAPTMTASTLKECKETAADYLADPDSIPVPKHWFDKWKCVKYKIAK